MEVGFDTIGNATVICYDKKPILVTDPWLSGTAYFGSWMLSHEISEEQLEAIRQCKYAWISHGHPDHLCVESLRQLKAERILLPDHYKGRIGADLQALGFQVQVLPNRAWTQLSDRIRVMSIADYNQDATLLIDINGRLVVDLNDAADRGWGNLVKNIIRQYKTTFLLKLGGFGDADMINFFDEEGKRILPRAHEVDTVGASMATVSKLLGTKYIVPFSSMHKYQRSDSIWVNPYITKVEDYYKGFESKSSEMLPAFIRYDCEKDALEEIKPRERQVQIYAPEAFGDDWAVLLDEEDRKALREYLGPIQHLATYFDYINFRVGGKDNIVELAKSKFGRGITFEVPKNSLMTAVQYAVFDDLLIGNFMKTTLHGQFGEERLYPHFTPYVAKYSDNGKARTREELEEYFKNYRKQAPIDYFRHLVESGSRYAVMSALRTDSTAYRTISRLYHFVKAM